MANTSTEQGSMKKFGRDAAILFFGIAVPIAALFQAYLGIKELSPQVNYDKEAEQLISDFGKAKEHLSSSNDYYMFSLMYVEHANQKTMINKQIMKVSIINIGFAVISIGMMLIILGINDGGLEGKAGAGDLRFDFKTGSSGIAVFVIGALMATAGGVLKNEYTTASIPGYGGGKEKILLENSILAHSSCKNDQTETTPEKCFYQVFEDINKELLK